MLRSVPADALPHLERRLQVVFVAFGEELVGIGGGAVLVQVLQILQVGSKVLLRVAAGPREDELGLQLRQGSYVHARPRSADDTRVLTHLEQREDDPLVGLGQDGEALFVGQEDAGGEDGGFDRLPEPLIDDGV